MDILYGADLGSVATDQFGNVSANLPLNVFSDGQGTNVFTLTRAVGTNFAVGAGTGGVVTSSPLGRVLFYAQDTDATLWLKNGTNYWAVNPVKISDVVQNRIAAAAVVQKSVTDSLDSRLSAVETGVGNLQTSGSRSWQMWRGRMAANKTTNNLNFTSLNFSSAITTPSAFAVSFTSDSVSVSVAGWYRATLRAGWTINGTGFRSALILFNIGATTMNIPDAPASVFAEDDRTAASVHNTTTSVSEDIYLTPTDSLLFVVRQNSGADLAVSNGRNITSASLEYLGTA